MSEEKYMAELLLGLGVVWLVCKLFELDIQLVLMALREANISRAAMSLPMVKLRLT